jgi:hypothetical protein
MVVLNRRATIMNNRSETKVNLSILSGTAVVSMAAGAATPVAAPTAAPTTAPIAAVVVVQHKS